MPCSGTVYIVITMVRANVPAVRQAQPVGYKARSTALIHDHREYISNTVPAKTTITSTVTSSRRDASRFNILDLLKAVPKAAMGNLIHLRAVLILI